MRLLLGPVERDAIVGGYVRSALRSRDKCICVLDMDEPDKILLNFQGDKDIDLEACVASRQIDIVRTSDTTMRSGAFSCTDMIGFWKASVASVMNAAKYPVIRSIGETASSLRELPDPSDVVRFESEMNRMLPLYPQILVCLFDLEKVGGAFLIEMVKTHPKMYVNGALFENPHYLTPDEWLNRMEVRNGSSS